MTNSIGMLFVRIPAATFTRGRESGAADERPSRAVTLGTYYIGQNEVTIAQFARFQEATGYKIESRLAFGDATLASHPMYGISRRDAVAFSMWLSAQERAVYRLPTEAEWEFAARGTDGRLQPWGNALGAVSSGVNWNRLSEREVRAATPPTRAVGSSLGDRSPFGVMDMAGNVQEWCLDHYEASYYVWSPLSNPYGPMSPTGSRVLRGGAWNMPPMPSATTARFPAGGNQGYTGFGFRLVREDEPE